MTEEQLAILPKCLTSTGTCNYQFIGNNFQEVPGWSAVPSEVIRLSAALEHWQQKVGKLHSQIDRAKHEAKEATVQYIDHTGQLMDRIAALEAELAAAKAGQVTVDQLAQIIRMVDGNHDCGAAELAERILSALTLPPAAIPEADPVGKDAAAEAALATAREDALREAVKWLKENGRFNAAASLREALIDKEPPHGA